MAVNDNLTLLGVICFIPILILGDPNRRRKAVEIMTDPMWIFQFLLMIIFICYVLFFYNPADKETDDESSKLDMRKAVYQGAIAFIIAICAAFDITVAPFWLVFLSSQYSPF